MEEQMRENKLRNLMEKDRPTLGTRVLIPWPGVMEFLGHTNEYDYVEFLSEYAPYDLHDFDNFARAAELTDMSSMIKIDQEPRTYLAERALMAGIQNILFVDIRNAEDAREAVNAVRAEPDGINGIRMDRRREYVGVHSTAEDHVRMCEDAVVALMIEKESAVENLEDILAVEGVDMVQFGPADYSLSLGKPGKTDHPEVKKAEEKVIQTALGMDVRPRAEIRTPEDAERYIDMGVTDFSLETDVRILYGWWKKNGADLNEILSDI
ncbi:hypothetical protein AKJ64_03440 [candidate division MSBL1 archaeon SCGC-AAA259E17]|uniref:HpcH/HpaI aldolase/citrate lyase domain-containing protein n=1 Tax=candidate division MSBL1 archaeon SCGC-AAA259E17 TaxID=1698263 RepID=A0A133UDU3_9EURY|nr:hypothetical protein AKJ64_03440 [candidate division MSBL1 archaeon SCGC-AAA259E17]